MERPTLPDLGNQSFRPIEPEDVRLGMEVFIVALFASGAMASHQGRVQSYGGAPNGGFFVHLRGTPFNLDPPWPVQAYIWEVQTWDGPPMAPEPERLSPREAIEKAMSSLASEMRRLL